MYQQIYAFLIASLSLSILSIYQLSVVKISMLALRSQILKNLTLAITYSYRTPRHVASFNQRIKMYQNKLDRYDRQFHMRAPDLSSKQAVTFPLRIGFKVRHRYNPKKRINFVDNTQKIRWNRLSPNEILLAFQKLEYLEYNEMIEGLRYLSQIKDQQQHDWNSHPWISQALDEVNKQFKRIKNKDHISIYYLMKKLGYNNEEFWKKIYETIEQKIYQLYPNQFEAFFLRYYKISDQYFSQQMKEKFLTLLEGRLRSFSPEGIIKVYEIYQQENRLDDYWKQNVFIPLFKSEQYTYCPKDLHRIFRYMLILDHQNDDRLYASLYKRLTKYKELTLEQLDLLQEVIQEVKDLFISHRVDPYLAHLKEMRKKVENTTNKKEIPIHELVRQDLIFYMQKKKVQAQNAAIASQQSSTTQTTDAQQ